MLRKYLFIIFILISSSCWAVDPFEDFHEYGQLSDEEIHDLHKGEMLYGDTEFGFILSRGNINSTSFKLKGNLYQDFEKWRNQFKIDSLYKRDENDDTGDSDVTANRVFVSAQGNYKVGVKNSSFFIYGDYEEDQFSGLKFKSTIATGYGARVYQGTKNKVDIDIGPGLYRSVADEDSTVSESEESKTGYLLRVAMQWERLVSKRTRFNQDVSIEQSLSGLNSRLKSETALISQVIGAVSLKFAYMYQHKQYAVFIFFVLTWIGGFVALAWNLIGADWPLIIFAGVLVLVGFLFHGLTVKVNDKTISWGFGPGVAGQQITLSDISEAKAVQNSYRHGIGIRITHDGWVYTVSGFSAVQLTLNDGTLYRVGTNDQQGLLDALKKQNVPVAQPKKQQSDPKVVKRNNMI